MVLASTLRAPRRELPTWHGNEKPIRTVNDLQVSHYETVVKRNRTKRLQPLVRIFHQLYANFGNFHGRSPSRT
jgi:hypothetical protein